MTMHEVLKVTETGRVAINRLQHLHVPFEVSEDDKGNSAIRISSEENSRKSRSQRLEFGTNKERIFSQSASFEVRTSVTQISNLLFFLSFYNLNFFY